LATNVLMLDDVRGRLEQDWSPEQIAGWLRREHPADPLRWISHETIYRSIYVAAGASAALTLPGACVPPGG